MSRTRAEPHRGGDRRERERELETERDRLRALFETIPDPITHVRFEDGEPILLDVNPAFEETFGYTAEEAVGRPSNDLVVGPERREAAERRLERQNERLEEFVEMVSHDLRNPLNVAQGRVELLQDEYDDEHLDAAERAHERMGALVEDILYLARQGGSVGTLEPVRLDEVVRGCWETSETSEARLVVETERTVEADRGQLRRLLENLLSNATEHGGPDVTVTVGDCRGGFYVADDGPGIDEAVRDRLFEAGYSTSQDGTGFGLRIVAQIADGHGWDVSATVSESGGARFEVTGVDEA